MRRRRSIKRIKVQDKGLKTKNYIHRQKSRAKPAQLMQMSPDSSGDNVKVVTPNTGLKGNRKEIRVVGARVVVAQVVPPVGQNLINQGQKQGLVPNIIPHQGLMSLKISEPKGRHPLH